MIARFIGWCIVALVTAVLIRALVTGVIHYDLDGRGTISAGRNDAPGEFWTIFFIGAASDAFLLWLLLR